MDERTWRVKELADYLSINERTVRRWIEAGMPAINVGSVLRPDWRIEDRQWRDYLAGRHGLTVQRSPGNDSNRADLDDLTAEQLDARINRRQRVGAGDE